jgi:hypothetical protein
MMRIWKLQLQAQINYWKLELPGTTRYDLQRSTNKRY